MNSAAQVKETPEANHFGASTQESEAASNAAIGTSVETLTKIYEDEINIAVFQRQLEDEVNLFSQSLINSHPKLNLRSVIKPENAQRTLTSILPDEKHQQAFVEDLSLLIEMYAYLFELDEVGVRLEVLDRAMCPRFHTDKLGCRLVSTYQGTATEWLYNHDVDRSKLGARSTGLNDAEAGLYPHEDAINQLNEGDVVLLKGDGWYNNEGKGAVHRSPSVPAGTKRIVVTMDFA